jgi:type IV pilus assembly protein PilM
VPFLQNRFAVPTEIANPLARIQYDRALFGQEDPMSVAPFLTVGIGLALRKVGDK